MDLGHRTNSPHVEHPRAERDSHDPLVEPLIPKIVEINRLLEDFRRLIELRSEELERLYNAACLLTRGKASTLLDVSESYLDRIVTKGELDEIRLGRRPHFALADLAQFIAARRTNRRARLSASRAARETTDVSPNIFACHPQVGSAQKLNMENLQKLNQSERPLTK